MTRVGAPGPVSREQEPVELTVAASIDDPDAEVLRRAKRATEHHRAPADHPGSGKRSNPALIFHRLRADIGRDQDAEALLKEAGAADEGQAARLRSSMRARKNAPLPAADLETTIRSITKEWRFLLGGLAELRDDRGVAVFQDPERAIAHVVKLAQLRGWVFTPHVRLLPDPFSGKAPVQRLGPEESGLLLLSTINVHGRPYRLGVGKEPKRDPNRPDEVWQFHRPYAFIDLEVANAVAQYEPSIFRRLQFIASIASHDLSAHSVVDVQLPGRDESYLLQTWERALAEERILDPRLTRVPNLEILSARLHRVLWSRVLAEDGGRAQRAILAHARRFAGSVEQMKQRMNEAGDPRAEELARYLLTVYFDKNLYFVMDPSLVRAQLAIEVPPGSFQREIHASNEQPFGEMPTGIGEILAQFMTAYADAVPASRGMI